MTKKKEANDEMDKLNEVFSDPMSNDVEELGEILESEPTEEIIVPVTEADVPVDYFFEADESVEPITLKKLHSEYAEDGLRVKTEDVLGLTLHVYKLARFPSKERVGAFYYKVVAFCVEMDTRIHFHTGSANLVVQLAVAPNNPDRNPVIASVTEVEGGAHGSYYIIE